MLELVLTLFSSLVGDHGNDINSILYGIQKLKLLKFYNEHWLSSAIIGITFLPWYGAGIEYM